MKRAALASNDYLDLIRRFPLRPLANDADLKAATAIVHELIDRGIDDLTSGEEDYLDVLSDLVKKYEDQHHRIPDASPDEVLRFLIEDRGTNQRTVALGSDIAVSTMSELLAGRREMNLDHMKKLAVFFGVDAGAFLPREKPRARATRRPSKR